MYEAFDTFLATETWHTSHNFDDQRFNLALNQVVRNAEFDPERMAEYFRVRVGANDEDHPFSLAIEHRRGQAEAVQSFLRHTE